MIMIFALGAVGGHPRAGCWRRQSQFRLPGAPYTNFVTLAFCSSWPAYDLGATAQPKIVIFGIVPMFIVAG